MKISARKVDNYDLYATHAWYVPDVKGMFGLFGLFLVGALLGGVVQAILGLFMPRQALLDYGMLVVYPVQFLPAMVFAANKSQRNALFDKGYKLNSAHFGKLGGWVMALVTILLAFSTMVVADLPNYLNFKATTAIPWMKRLYDIVIEMMNRLTDGPLWSSFLVTAVFAPVFEEWLCRGMVLRALLTKIKPGWAIVVSALFFAVLHLNPWQALNAFILGVVMGYVYYRTGSLLLTMLIHFVNNATAVILSQIPSVEQYDFWIDMLGKGTYTVVFVIGLAVLGLTLSLFRQIPLEQDRGNVDEVNPLAE